MFHFFTYLSMNYKVALNFFSEKFTIFECTSFSGEISVASKFKVKFI